MKKLFRLFFVNIFIIYLFLMKIKAEESNIICPICGSSNISFVSTTATCTEGGITTYKCENINAEEHVASVVVNTEFIYNQTPLGHDYKSETTKKASCLTEGIILHSCTRCDYTYESVLPITDHSYKTIDTIKATCTTTGSITKQCTICNKKIYETLNVTGHNYIEVEKVEATCSTDGYIIKKCANCFDTQTEILNAINHNYVETERIEPTCTVNGKIINICKNCNDIQEEIINALGHNVNYTIIKQATCTNKGLKSGTCENCGQSFDEEISIIEHNYSNEWTIEKEATIISTGLQSKICKNCNKKITEVIDKKGIPVAACASAVGISSISILAFALKKAGKFDTKKITEKIVESSIKETSEIELFKPSFEDKTIVTFLKKNSFYHSLKVQKHLKIIETDYENLIECVKDNEPNLIIIDSTELDINEIKELIKNIHNEVEESIISILVSKIQIEISQKELNLLKEERLIKEYCCIDSSAQVLLVKIVLPIMKPNLKSDEGLENIGMIADALNIPGISTIIDLYTSGREIKETIEEGKEDDLTFVDKATIITDIASILGLDTISSVAGLVCDVDDIKSSIQSKIGGNEINTTKDAVTDIIDVASEIINK